MAAQAPVKLTQLADTDMTLADSAIDVRGRRVVDRNGDEIGTVDALMLDEAESKVRFLRVAAGGFLGVGERLFLIPVDAVTRIDDNHVHVDQTREHVAGSPSYDPAIVPDADYYGDLYGYYGYAPFWAPGYLYPTYPYYR